MKVLITGATGLIGSRIVKDCLERDIKVNFLTTRKNKIDGIPGCCGFYWDPQKKIGVCADWFIGPRLESGWISAHDLFKKIN